MLTYFKERIYKVCLMGAIALLVIVLCVAGFFIWQRYYPATAHGSWSYTVAYESVNKPSALLVDDDGNLIVAEELTNNKGRLVSISPDGKQTELVAGLNKPDGLVKFKNGFLYSQEGGEHPVIWFENGQAKPLFTGINVQGLTVEGDYLYAFEDRKHAGRLFKYNTVTGEMEILRNGLNQSEGLAICPNGLKYYNNKTKGRVRILTEDGSDPVYLQQINQPSFLMCTQEGLWISEDATNRARLLLYKPNGKLVTVMSFLRAPQHLYSIDDDNFFLAEQGRNRILKLHRN